MSRFDPSCAKCPDKKASNADRTECLQCDDASVELFPSESDSDRKCICKEENHYLKEEGGAFKCEKVLANDWKKGSENPAGGGTIDFNPFWRAPRNIPMTEPKRCIGEGFVYE